jgi:hypothetical protein
MEDELTAHGKVKDPADDRNIPLLDLAEGSYEFVSRENE